MQVLAPIPLTTDQMPQAFPLARAYAPGLDLDTWLAFGAHRVAAGTGGLIALRDDRGYFRGLYGYQIRHDLRDGVVLEVDLAITMDLVNRAEAADVLMTEIDALSLRLGCSGVHIRLRPDQGWLRRWSEQHGYVICAVTPATTSRPAF